jgi:filamentous hemagglutinin family protein
MRLVICFALFVCHTLLSAAPQGLSVVSGEAVLHQVSPHVTEIHSGNKAIVHWDQFSIGQQETVRFVQPNASASILNRVTGFSKTDIQGALLSNGKVYLINQNGIVIGPNARIEAASFVGSTLDLLNEDFLTKNEFLFFGDSPSEVINLGKIKALEGDVVLFGRNISNLGSIDAENGHVAMASGREILLQPHAHEKIFIRVPIDPTIEEDPFLQHSGTLSALSAELKSSTSSFAKAIHVSGSIDALTTVEQKGRIYLVAEQGGTTVAGTLNALGGEIHVLGKDVCLIEKVSIDVSNEKAGGTILIGGDYKGQNPKIMNASQTSVSSEARLLADAQIRGNGGKIIVWSDDATTFYGYGSARGGEYGGDGGFVEVSGKFLDFDGVVNRLAPLGNPGTLLLDPLELTIKPNAGNVNTSFGSNQYTITDCSLGTAIISSSNLATNLGLGSVTIDVTAAGSGCSGNITIQDVGSFTANGVLTLNADGNLTITRTATGPNANTFKPKGILLNIGGNLLIDGSATCANPSGCSVAFGGITTGTSGTIGGNLTLLGGLNTKVYLGDGGTSLVATGDINLNVGKDILLTFQQGATSTNTAAVIGYGNFTTTNNNFLYTGNILLNAGGKISLLGGANQATPNISAAHIGHISSAKSPLFTTDISGNIQLIAAESIILTGATNGFSNAQIGQGLTSSGVKGTNVNYIGPTNLTLVTDQINLCSTPAGVTNGLTLSNDHSILFAPTTSKQAELKIYTVSQENNQIQTTSISEGVFPPTFTTQEQSGICYPSGAYPTATPYVIYYKKGAVSSTLPINGVLLNQMVVSSSSALGNIFTSTSLVNNASESNPSTSPQGTAGSSPFNPVQLAKEQKGIMQTRTWGVGPW